MLVIRKGGLSGTNSFLFLWLGEFHVYSLRDNSLRFLLLCTLLCMHSISKGFLKK